MQKATFITLQYGNGLVARVYHHSEQYIMVNVNAYQQDDAGNVFEPKTPTPWIVGWLPRYDAETNRYGWAQGHYFTNEADARAYLKERGQ